jgi:hypothetical protein
LGEPTYESDQVVRYLIKITGGVPVFVYLIIYDCRFLIMLSDIFF